MTVRLPLAVALLVVAAWPVAAQDVPPPRPEPLRVFLDCQTRGCDRDFFQTELGWLTWVRDRQTADVHLLITSQDAGGGGDRFTLDFLGRGAFQDDDRQLRWTSAGDATDDEVRTGLVQRIGLGMVPYALATAAGRELTVVGPTREGGERAQAAVDDPWDAWVFRVELEGNVEGESRQRSVELESSLRADRTTEAWRLGAEVEYRRDDEEFELDDRTVDVLRENWNAETYAVKSVGDHWAVGVRGQTGKSTRFNQDYYLTGWTGVEFSVFPYAESTRRALLVQYLVGVNYFDWTETTIYGQDAETRTKQSLTTRLDLVQPWGEVDVALTGSHFFHDLERWNLDLWSRLEVRLFQGFSLNVGGSYRWVRDQLFIPGEGLSDDEILLELQELQTDFEYRTFFGITYRFGSIFSDVVNPRFGQRRF